MPVVIHYYYYYFAILALVYFSQFLPYLCSFELTFVYLFLDATVFPISCRNCRVFNFFQFTFPDNMVFSLLFSVSLNRLILYICTIVLYK